MEKVIFQVYKFVSREYNMTLCSLKCELQSLDISTKKISSRIRSDETLGCQFTMRIGYPISVKGEAVNLNEDLMELNKWYPFSYKGQKHLAVKISDKVVDIYKVRK